MALKPTRMEYRVALSDVDRGLQLDEAPLIVGRHPSETMEHLTLRVLARCLLASNEEWDRLEFGPGLSDPDAPDLVARDLTGRLSLWVECGAADPDKVRRAVQQNQGVRLHAVVDDPRRADELAAALADFRHKSAVSIWILDRALVAALAASDAPRRRWSVTVVGGHLYVDENGEMHDAPFETRSI